MCSYKLNKKCCVCGSKITDINKTGFCNIHRDRTGKNNPFYGKKHSKETIEIIRNKTSIKSKQNWKNENYRKKIIKGISKPRKKEFSEEQSLRIKKWYQDNPEQKIIRSQHMKKSWIDEKIVPNHQSCNRSKMEKELLRYVENICSDKVITKSIKINNKWLIPDIVIENLGLIIEFYGDYWHANPKFYKRGDIVHHNLTAGEIWEHDKERVKKFDNIFDKKQIVLKVIMLLLYGRTIIYIIQIKF